MSYPTKINPCIFGYGIVCGGEVHLTNDCQLIVSAGTVIMPSGQVVHFSEQSFRHYWLQSELAQQIEEATGIHTFYELTNASYDAKTMDCLKQQHPEDFPEEDFLGDKILGLFQCKNDNAETDSLRFLLIPIGQLAALQNLTTTSETPAGLFSHQVSIHEVDPLQIDQQLRPELNLPTINLRRFGYQNLGLVNPAFGIEDNNFQYPYAPIHSFENLFFEYKNIIEQYLEELKDALEVLHQHFGTFLSHKGADYLERYRKVLTAKWQYFCEGGEHLYYVQYFYDWLRDLIQAYQELCEHLVGFSTSCICTNNSSKDNCNFITLGSVLGGRSTYSPLIFRDIHTSKLNDEQVRKVRLLHWRMMMMVWTFDLPFLHLEKVLYDFKFDPGLEEEWDSTNYWEWVNRYQEEADNEVVNVKDLLIKTTPTTTRNNALGQQAIPYYYPLDSNSIYSLHRFWDYQKTRMHQTDQHLSYNAYEGDELAASTELINDSYTQREEIIFPLAFDLEKYRAYKMEGHIGKLITANPSDVSIPGLKAKSFYINSFDLLAYLFKYNLPLEVIAIDISTDLEMDKPPFTKAPIHLEHQTSIQNAQTLVLLFNSVAEQIELEECKKDEDPEIVAFSIVGDFVLPYRYSCCPNENLNALTLSSKLERTSGT